MNTKRRTNRCSEPRKERSFGVEGDSVYGHDKDVWVQSTKGGAFMVSLFEGFHKPIPIGEVDLLEWVLCPAHQTAVKQIRQTTSPEERRKLKSQLPCVTPSGIFSHRSYSGLIQHTSILSVDIDRHENPTVTDWKAVLASLEDLPGLIYAGLSASGDGIFLLIRLDDCEAHKYHFYAIEDELKEKGLIVDSQCKDLARLRAASYDPDPFYNPRANVYTKKMLPRPKVQSLPSPMSDDKRERTRYRVLKLIRMIEEQGVDIVTEYEAWFPVGCALAAGFGEEARPWFHTVSRQSDNYDPKTCDYQFTKCLSFEGYKIGTFFHYCKVNNLMATSTKK